MNTAIKAARMLGRRIVKSWRENRKEGQQKTSLPGDNQQSAINAKRVAQKVKTLILRLKIAVAVRQTGQTINERIQRLKVVRFGVECMLAGENRQNVAKVQSLTFCHVGRQWNVTELSIYDLSQKVGRITALFWRRGNRTVQHCLK